MSGPTTMEGYLYKKGHALPIMQRRYCVLKGTMLAYYTNIDDYTRKLTPRNVLEVTSVKDLSDVGGSGLLSPPKKANTFEIEYLGGTTYTCQADSREEKMQWLTALQHALDEPDRIVQDEIEDAQRHLQQEADKEDRAMALASEAVEKAQQLADEALAMDAAIKNAQSHCTELRVRLAREKILLEEAHKKTEQTKSALQRARLRAHDAVFDGDEEKKGEDDYEGEDTASVTSTAVIASQDMATRISQLAAQLEVDHTAEATQLQHVTSIEMSIKEYEQQIEEFAERAKNCATEGRKLRETATVNLQSAHSAKHISRLRVSSWTASSSHLDPLAEGYLLCKHPMKPSMHRRYYVLYGNTLCWYKDVDDYNQHVNTPSGVVHVSAVSEWSGKVGGMKTFPHAFAIAAVEGKTLHCSAPTKQSTVTWDTALHIGLTMPALSPHRAMQAKARRDSFDLLSSTVQNQSPGPMQRRASLAHISSTEKESTNSSALELQTKQRDKISSHDESVSSDIIEGYLVKKSSLFPAMKKKYCVLSRLRFVIFESHDQYTASKAETAHGDHEEVLVCGVSDWDGYGSLLQYNHGFQIHTVNHQMIQCSAANENEKSKWVAGIHEALLRFKYELLSPSRREENMLEEARASILSTVELSEATSSALAASEKFRDKIRELYLQHHPAKVHDVPMLIEKYSGREGALVTHFDRIFGTELCQDTEVQQLIQTLESSAQDARRGRRRLSSGVNSGLREFGKMMGYLKWKPDDTPGEQPPSSTESCFCVLSVDKLVRYASETVYMTEPFNTLDVVQLLSINDLQTQSSTSFSVTYCRADTDGKPPSRPSSPVSPKGRPQTMELDALTEEQRTLWMPKIRTGLGIVETARPTSPTSPTANTTESTSKTTDVEGLRRKLIDYYRRHNPRRVAEIDTLLHYFAGREKLLLVDLDATYGTNISTDADFLSMLPHGHLDSPGEPKKVDALRYESYLWVKHPILGSGFQKFYCVIRNTQWYCFENSRDAHAHLPSTSNNSSDGTATSPRAATKDPLLIDTVVSLNNLNAKLHSMRVLNIEGQAYGAILLRADVDPLFQDWVRVLRQAADTHQKLDAPVQAEEEPAWWQSLRDKLTQFYRDRQPGQVEDVGKLLRSFEGRERELLQEIDNIFNSHLAQDPEFVDLIPSTDSSETITGEDGDMNSSILMEGYLVKRGHLVPSMRKRYCVLVKNILTYYLTHEDSRNADTQPLGSFRVEIVSDWHGKTTTQTYDYGMELETHDGKTFFCAAFSSEEKTQWMRAFHHGIAVARSESESNSSERKPDDFSNESDEDRRKRDQFRDLLVAFYQEHNPRKLVDLDLLLSCYKGRELAMLEAMDATYGSQLLQDEAILRLLPPLNAHTQALRRLEYDGPLERAAGGNSEAAWKHAQQVYVSQKGLTLTFYASREGFKAGAAALTSAADKAVTVLAVKPVENACRFAVETTDHVWMYFQAPNVLEKGHWLQLLQAALDSMLAKTILEEERLYLEEQGTDASSPRGSVLMKGFLMVRIDFLESLEEFRQQLRTLPDSPTSTTSPKKDPSLGSAKKSVMKECYVVLQNHNELSLYSDENRSEAIATVTVISTRAWKAIGGVAPMSSDSTTVGRFPFQILTQEQVVLSCGAATDLDRAKWIQQTRRGAQQAAALDMLQEQFTADQEVPKMERRRSTLDDKTGELRGYLYYQPPMATQTTPEQEEEGFLVLNKLASLRIFADESAFLGGGYPRFSFQVVDIVENIGDESIVQTPGGHFRKLFKGFKSSSGSPKRLAFQLQLFHERATGSSDDGDERQTILFFPATTSEQSLWANSIRAGINTRKGEQLLSDEKAVLAIENAHASAKSSEVDVEEQFILPTSAMEGELTLWRVEEPARRVFAMLTHCVLRGFVSHDAATSYTGGDHDQAPLVEIVVDSISEWNPEAGTHNAQGSTGFRVKSPGGVLSLSFTAPTPRDKNRWVHAIQHEIDFALAEQYLDEDAKEFARLAAAHVAAANAHSEPGASFQQVSGVPNIRLEGYVRVRHQFVGSMWRERFAVVMGTSLWLFKDGGDACADDWLRRAIERHEVISAQEWRPPTASLSTGSRDAQYAHGMRLENQDGASLELAFSVQQDRDAWLSAVRRCLESVMSAVGEGGSRFISRDAALPFVPGAAMEGFLKVREKSRSRFKRTTKWTTRYAVLIGTQWLLYETQQQALVLHGHNQQGDAGQKEEGDDVLPQAVLDIIHVELWQASGGKKLRSGEEELETHGFIVVASKGSAFGTGTVSPTKKGLKIAGDILECRSQTSLERKRWLNAMEDQIRSVQQEQEMVRKAMEQHKDKTAAQQAVKAKFQNLRDDANRQSLYVKDVLASLATEATTSEEEEDDSDQETKFSDEDKVHGPLAIRSRSIGRVRSPENSPMYRSDLQDRDGAGGAFFGDDHDGYVALGSPSKGGKKPVHPWYSWQSLFACCFDRPPSNTGYAASVAPLKNPKYVYEYYSEDKPSSLDDF